MEITGYDSVLFVADLQRQAVHDFLMRLARIWPNMLVTIDTDPPEPAAPTRLPDLDQIPTAGAEIICRRDRAMDRHWKTHGYEPMADGAGPLLLIYRPRYLDFNVRVEHDHRWSNPIQQPDAYDARLIVSRGVEITLTTPDCPQEHHFSQLAYELLIDSLTSNDTA
jgi:hypothetical protein